MNLMKKRDFTYMLLQPLKLNPTGTSLCETRSEETRKHEKRVAEYSKLLALYLGIPAQEAEILKQSVPMHDIGKVAIPDYILNKPGKHTLSKNGKS